jgi:hypothetical protein
MTGTISRRRRLWIASVGAGILAAFVLGYGNQGLETWRLSRWQGGSPWLRPLFSSLNGVAWRVSAPSEAQAARVWPGLGVADANRAWIGAIVRDVAIIVLTWLLIYAACSGVSAVRGRAALFFGSLAAVLIAVAGTYLAVIPLQFGTSMDRQIEPLFYYDELQAGMIAGFTAGFVAAVVAVLIYRSDPNALASPFAPPFAPQFAERNALVLHNDPEADTLIEGYDPDR